MHAYWPWIHTNDWLFLHPFSRGGRESGSYKLSSLALILCPNLPSPEATGRYRSSGYWFQPWIPARALPFGSKAALLQNWWRQERGGSSSPCFFLACSHTDLHYAIPRVLNGRLFPIVEGGRWGWGEEKLVWQGVAKSKGSICAARDRPVPNRGISDCLSCKMDIQYVSKEHCSQKQRLGRLQQHLEFCQHAK